MKSIESRLIKAEQMLGQNIPTGPVGPAILDFSEEELVMVETATGETRPDHLIIDDVEAYLYEQEKGHPRPARALAELLPVWEALPRGRKYAEKMRRIMEGHHAKV